MLAINKVLKVVWWFAVGWFTVLTFVCAFAYYNMPYFKETAALGLIYFFTALVVVIKAKNHIKVL